MKSKKVSIETLRNEAGSHVFNQEYLLRPLGEEDIVIQPHWIQYHSLNLDCTDSRRFEVIMAIDPAISEKESADFSAISIFVKEHESGNAYCIRTINEHLSYESLKMKAYELYKLFNVRKCIVEDVAAQNWLVQDLKKDYNMNVLPKKRLADKRSRLVAVSKVFEQGKVYFRKEHKTMVDQLINFGACGFDDLVDTCIDCLDYFYFTKKSRLVKGKAF